MDLASRLSFVMATEAGDDTESLDVLVGGRIRAHRERRRR